MGSLRFLLAISVAYGHAGDFLGFPLVPGDTAVQCFYAISGFYMSLVLNEKYRPESSSYSLFISNRFLRLFPAYAAVLLLTLLLALMVSSVSRSADLPFVTAWHSLTSIDWSSAALLIGSQIIMWGQDFYLFLTLKHGALAFWPDFHTAPQPLLALLVIPQAWTLGLEFSFYLIAPFIVRRSVAAIMMVFAASLGVRLGLHFGFGYGGDPWSYRFFPSELAVFLIGALAYRVYKLPTIAFDWRSYGVFAIAIVCLATALLINRWHGVSRVASVAFWAFAVGAIPFLFRMTKAKTVDRYLGELSYPIYICHILVIWFLDATVTFGSRVTRGSSIIAVTLIVSAALYWAIDRPVDAWRHWRFAARKPERLKLVEQTVKS
jgi:peptidoglycan/LPS O-acetylase OafA/YrhL